MASESIKKMFMQRMFDNQKSKFAASKIGDIMGQGEVMQETAPFQQGPDETFPGEQPIQGLFDITQEAAPATGLFDTENPDRFLEASRDMIASGSPALQSQGMAMLNNIQNSELNPKSGGAGGVRTFAFGADDGKMQRGFLGEGNKLEPLGQPYDPRNPYLDISTAFINPNDPNAMISKNLRDAEIEKETGKNIVSAGEAAIKQYNSAIEQTAILDEAMAAIDDDASTSKLASYSPTLKASTARLEAAGNRLALNLLTTVTMGALSKSEMDILQATVMPKMPAADLKIWLQNRKDAQIKLSDLYLEAAQFYNRGGTKVEFITMKKKQSDEKNKLEEMSLDDLVGKYGD